MDAGDMNTRRDGEEPEAPPGLKAALKELPARRVFVPPTVDEAVLRAARKSLAPQPRPSLSWIPFWKVWPRLVAACLALLAGIYLVVNRNPSKDFAREDVNRDGEVDVLDAFQLARELQGGRKPDATLDLNGDGRVDRQDIDLVAAQAVKLEKGRS
jgi:hypothetical protein